MRAPRWLCLLTALVALGGSGCPDDPCFSPPSIAPTSSRLFGVGEDVSLRVTAGITNACGDASERSQVPETVTVEVRGPDNQLIPATAQLDASRMSANVSFTPPVKGRYHLLVAFAPVGSLQQFGILVAEDRRREAPLMRITSMSSCPYLDRTQRGTWLCGPNALATPSSTPQLLGGVSTSHTMVAGNVVWRVYDNQVLRYVDTGTGTLELSASTAYPPSGGTAGPDTDSHLATEDELLLVLEGFLYHYRYDAGTGRISASATQWAVTAPLPMGVDQASAILVRAGTRLLIVHRLQDPQTFALRLQACPFEPGGASGGYVRVQTEGCQTLEGEPVGFEDGVLWTRTFTFSGTSQETLRRYAVSGGRLVEQGTLTLDGQLTVSVPFLRPGPVLPPLFPPGTFEPFAAPRWSPDTGTVELELAPRPFGGTVRLGARYFWLELESLAGVSVFPRVRPSTP